MPCQANQALINLSGATLTTQIDLAIDSERLNGLLGQAVVEFGATVNAALVVIGDRLGLYRLCPVFCAFS